jgi:hypothetical protein
MKITVPASLDEAQDRLGSLGRLLTAGEWEKAAILAAFVEVTKQGKVSSDFLSADEFAALTIVGLKSAVTVRRYVNAWTDQVGTRPRPGEKVELPTVDFSDVAAKPTGGYNGGDSRQPSAGSIAKVISAADAETTAEAVASLPEEDLAKVRKAINEVPISPDFQAVLDRSNAAKQKRLEASGGEEPKGPLNNMLNLLTGSLINTAAQKVTDAIGEFEKDGLPTDPEVALLLQESYLNLKGLVDRLGEVMGIAEDWDDALVKMAEGGN